MTSTDDQDKITTQMNDVQVQAGRARVLQADKEIREREELPRIVEPLDPRQALPAEVQFDLLWLIADELGFSYEKATHLRAKRERLRQMQLAAERAGEIKRDQEQKRLQIETNRKDWNEPITEKLRLNDFIIIIPAIDRTNFSISKDGIITGPKCHCGFEMKYPLVEHLHELLQNPDHNWLWIRRNHRHLPDPRNPASSGFIFEPAFCVWFDAAALSRAKLGKPFNLQSGILPQVEGDRPLI